jgi:hypothetical protein
VIIGSAPEPRRGECEFEPAPEPESPAMLQAPCAGCGNDWNRTDLDKDRLCPDCRYHLEMHGTLEGAREKRSVIPVDNDAELKAFTVEINLSARSWKAKGPRDFIDEQFARFYELCGVGR